MPTPDKAPKGAPKAPPRGAPAKLNAAAELPPLPAEGAVIEHAQSTFADWGQQLPIGHIQGGTLYRGFSLKPFTMKEERELEGLRKARGKMTLAGFVVEVMSRMLTSYGPWDDFQSLDETQRRLLMTQAWMADVIYMYIWLRIQALGAEMKFGVECPHCNAKVKLPADLTLTDVTVVEDIAALSRRHVLRDGLDVAGASVTELVLQPPRWQAMESVTGVRTSTGDVKMAMIQSAIRQLGDGKRPVTIDILESLTKRDLEMLTRVIDDLSPGPDLTLEVTCPSCREESKHPLNWSWDFFFTAASL
jgi:hypothetical protein